MRLPAGTLEDLAYQPSNDGGKLLDISFEHSDLLWPWSGYLAFYIR
jgi:membrane-bound transcription factor site-1 protease